MWIKWLWKNLFFFDVSAYFLLTFIPTVLNFTVPATIGLMQKYPPIFKKMFLNDVALLWMRGFHAYDTASVS